MGYRISFPWTRLFGLLPLSSQLHNQRLLGNTTSPQLLFWRQPFLFLPLTFCTHDSHHNNPMPYLACLLCFHGKRHSKLPMPQVRHPRLAGSHTVVQRMSGGRQSFVGEPRRGGQQELPMPQVRHIGAYETDALIYRMSGRQQPLVGVAGQRGQQRLPMQEMRHAAIQRAHTVIHRLSGW